MTRLLAINRYVVRMLAYALLATSTYPYGMWGDADDSDGPELLHLHPDARIWVSTVVVLGAVVLLLLFVE